ncbi:MAG: DUF3857 and transglutaminase domain-containing protein [Ignavibacteriaceae bacterium]|nr:DUF3857 and transglutaminase domain-containing protein [Ignavibacteriaceae bacterium]
MKKFGAFLSVAIISFVFCSCAGSPFMDLGSLKDELTVKEFPGQSDYPDDDGVVLYDSHHEDIRIDDDYNFETIVRIRRLTKVFKNVDKYSEKVFVLSSSDKLLTLNARIINPDGKIIELKPSDFHTVNGSEDDYTQTVKFTYPSVEKNSILEYDCRIYEKIPLITDVWDIQGSLPKMLSTYKITAPYLLLMKPVNGGAGWNWKYKDYNCRVPAPKVKNSSDEESIMDKEITFTWEQRDIPAFTPDPEMPPHKNYIKYLKFAPSKWKTWADVSDFFYKDFFKPSLVVSKEVTAKAAEITKNYNDEVDKIKNVYDFVQTLRYVDVDLGDASLTPEKPDVVLKRKYGDCKDKSVLLIAMLKSLGIQSKPVLVLTHDEGVLDNNFACWNFNHMIVKAETKDGKIFWIDPATKYCKLGFLPYQCENLNALVLNDDGTSEIEYTPKNSSADNLENLYMKLDLSKPDSININVAVKFKGELNLKYKNRLSENTHSEIMKFCKSMISEYFLNAEVTDYTIRNIDSTDADLKLEFNAKSPNTMLKQGNPTFLSVDQFKLPVDLEWLGREKRTYDIEFGYPYTVFKTIEILLPENKYIVKDLPANTSYAGQALSYLRTFYNYGNEKIVGTEKFSVNQKDIKVEYYTKIKEFFDNIKAKSDEKIILTNK